MNAKQRRKARRASPYFITMGPVIKVHHYEQPDDDSQGGYAGAIVCAVFAIAALTYAWTL